MANKKLLALIASMALVAAMALAGCGGSQPAPSSSSAPESSAASSAAAEASSSAAAPAASSAAAPAASSAAAPAASSDAYIGEDAAIEAALAHAGINQADTTELKAELDTDDATVHYEVEFKSAGTEYSYDIDATTGEVLSFESEVDDD